MVVLRDFYGKTPLVVWRSGESTGEIKIIHPARIARIDGSIDDGKRTLQ
jgi:hypothetical protein